MPEKVDLQYCHRLVEGLLRKKATEAGHETERMRLAHNRGYLTGMLARLALENHDIRRMLERLFERK